MKLVAKTQRLCSNDNCSALEVCSAFQYHCISISMLTNHVGLVIRQYSLGLQEFLKKNNTDTEYYIKDTELEAFEQICSYFMF